MCLDNLARLEFGYNLIEVILGNRAEPKTNLSDVIANKPEVEIHKGLFLRVGDAVIPVLIDMGIWKIDAS